MADIFNFYVYDDRSIKFQTLEPIMQEDNKVAVWRFRIPKILNNIDMSSFAWWFVYVNANREKYSEALTLTADGDDPDNFLIADYPIDYSISLYPGQFSFALEAINADSGGTIENEWHTKTYEHSVTRTLQGNQAEYAETQSDIISALIVQIQAKYNALVGGAVPLIAQTVAEMDSSEATVYLYTGSEENYHSGYWYYWDGSDWQEGGQYASGITIDPTLTLPGQAADSAACGCLKSDIRETQNGHSLLYAYGTFVNGTLYSGSLRTNVKYRVTTTNILEFDYDITLNVTDAFKFGVHTFVDNVFSQDTGWHTSAYTIPANTQFKPVIARRTEDTTETADIATFVKQVTFQTYTQQTATKAGEYIDSHFYLPVSAISEELLKQGNTGDTGEDSTFAKNAGAVSDILFALNDIAIYADVDTYPNARVFVHFFDDNDIWQKSSGWQIKYIIPKGSIFRVLLRQVYNSTSAVSVSDIYASFTIWAGYGSVRNKCCQVISHQGNVNTTDNSCKLEGYIKAGMAGFEFAECDVKFTSDDVPVCSHDGAFTDATTGVSIRIESYTLAEVKEFDFHGGTIATLDEVVAVCKKYGMGLIIDQYNPDWTATRYDAIFAVINKYRFAKSCKHVIYDYACAPLILSRDKTAWIICGQSYSSTTPDSAIELADDVITDYNKVDVMFYYGLGASAIRNAIENMDSRYGVNIYILDTIALKAEFAPMATSITTNTDPFLYF